MRRRHVGIEGMDDERDADRLESEPREFGSSLGRRGGHLFTVDMGIADPGLLEDGTFAQYAADSAATARSVPGVASELTLPVEHLELGDNPVLQ